MAQTTPRIHAPIHGLLPTDTGIEMFADLPAKRMYFMQNGSVQPFSNLPSKIAQALLKKFMDDRKAQEELGHLTINEAVERFAFCLYGAADSIPDVDGDGNLGATDNFRCGKDCTCLNWESKSIGTDTVSLTNKEIEVVDALAEGTDEANAAFQLDITISTLRTHKKNLFTKLGVFNTSGLLMKCAELKIIQ